MSNNLEVISCVTDNSVLVTKSHIENFLTKSQLIVNESQEALFYKEGQALDLFPSGRHTLDTNNLPFFRKVFGKLFGGNTPFPCEVFFINKVSVLDMLWGTPNPITLEDPQYGLIVGIKANGQTGLRVKDSRKFVVKVVGQLSEFAVEDIRRTIKGMMMPSLTSLIASTIVNERVGVLEIPTRLDSLSTLVQARLNEKLDDIGLEAVHFNIGEIFPEASDVAKLKDAKATAASRKVQGFTYQDERKFDVFETAAGNAGTAGGMINAGVGFGMGFGMMGEMSRATANTMHQAMAQQPAAQSAKLCPNCNAPLAPGAKFCANCGNAVPAEPTCPNCNAPLAPGSRFCGNCGQALAAPKKFCPGCGTQAEGNAQFCANCGHKFS